MNIKDLSLFNWVKCKGEYFLVANLNQHDLVEIGNTQNDWACRIEEIEPITFTEELAEKIGFVKDSSLSVDLEIESGGFHIRVQKIPFISIGNWFCHIDDADFDTVGRFEFDYVHELQNGIRLITKQEFEIYL